MTFLKIIGLQTLLLLAASVVATLLNSVLIAPSFLAFQRPGGFIIITLINTSPYIAVGIALSSLRYMISARLSTVTVSFFAIVSAFQLVSIFVSAPSLHMTRYYEHVPLFIDGKVTGAGVILVIVDIMTAAAAFALASNAAGIYKKGIENERS